MRKSTKRLPYGEVDAKCFTCDTKINKVTCWIIRRRNSDKRFIEWSEKLAVCGFCAATIGLSRTNKEV